MESIIESLQCWWREKEEVVKNPPSPPPSPSSPNTILKDIYCSCCFKYIENETFLVRKAKIDKKIYGFCEEECYLEWLRSPTTMLFGKIN
jgi:hypothetical protein|tara:strand:+ start:7202 stop:7471 length:270 start_codon:yes stop_codon:yes gene_type:complete